MDGYVYKYEPNMLHAKLLIVNDHCSGVGVSNLDNRCFRINGETTINIFNPEFAAKLHQVLAKGLKNARRYNLEPWQRRSWYKRLIERIAMIGATC